VRHRKVPCVFAPLLPADVWLRIAAASVIKNNNGPVRNRNGPLESSSEDRLTISFSLSPCPVVSNDS